MRNQMEGITGEASGTTRSDAKELQVRVEKLEREREQLIQCLEGLNRTTLETEISEHGGARMTAGGSEMVESLMKERRAMEETIVELQQLRDGMQAENQEARMHIQNLEHDKNELMASLKVCARGAGCG